MNNLTVGLELLYTGLAVVFAVLLFLMYLMKFLSAVAGAKPAEVQTPMQPPVVTQEKLQQEELRDEELIAAMAALSSLLPKNKQAVVRFRATGSVGSPADESEIAALIGALTCVMNNGTMQKIVSVKPLT